MPSILDASPQSTNYYKMSKDQNGCRFLQHQLQFDPKLYVQLWYNLNIYINELSLDPFGNYLVQKIIEKAPVAHLTSILKHLDIEKQSINPFGTRVMQTLIEHLNTTEQYTILVEKLQPFLISFSSDCHANHIVRKLFMNVPQSFYSHFHATLLNATPSLSMDRFGCCVLQIALQNAKTYQSQYLLILTKHLQALIGNAYGNYLLQFCIEGIPGVADNWSTVFVRDFKNYCMDRCASNVMEKCLRQCTMNRNILINEVLRHLDVLINDQYGNYVVQTSIEYSDTGYLKLFDKRINNLDTSKSNAFGKFKIHLGRNVLAKLKRKKSKVRNSNRNSK